jgi:hypothetical protein
MSIMDFMASKAIGFSEFSFLIHSRTGLQVLPETLRRIVKGTGCRAETARAIIAATDGTVTLDDIVLAAAAATAAEEAKEASGSSGA